MKPIEYMLVSNDEYELPIFTAGSTYKLARLMGCCQSAVTEAIRHNAINRKYDARIVKVTL